MHFCNHTFEARHVMISVSNIFFLVKVICKALNNTQPFTFEEVMNRLGGLEFGRIVVNEICCLVKPTDKISIWATLEDDLG